MFEMKRTEAFDKWLKGLTDAKGRARVPISSAHTRCARRLNHPPNSRPRRSKEMAKPKVKVTKKVRAKNPLGIAPYDSADYLNTERDIKHYLQAVFDEPVDQQMLIHTLGVVARARGMMQLAKDTGITRAGLYKALSPDGNPTFETVAKIVGAFGMRLTARAAT
jgi:probable addiction module antidote protein